MPNRLICGLNTSISFSTNKNKPIISIMNTIIPRINNVLKILSIEPVDALKFKPRLAPAYLS